MGTTWSAEPGPGDARPEPVELLSRWHAGQRAGAEEIDVDGQRTRVLLAGAGLPRGIALADAVWRRRHRAITFLLAAHVPGIALFSLFRGYGLPHAVVFAGIVATFTTAALLATSHRMFAMTASTLGLMTASALVVHLAGGRTEAFFHVLVLLAVVSLYQSWLPFLLSIAFVVVHHGTIGVINPAAVYDHESAWRDPWTWALVHAASVLALSMVNLVSWKLSERATTSIDRLRRQNEVLLDAAAEGIIGLDPNGIVMFVNPAAARMLQWDTVELVGRDLHAEVHHTRADGEPYDREQCPLHRTIAEGLTCTEDSEVFWRRDGTSLRVEYTSTPIRDGDLNVGAVVTFADISARIEAEDYRLEVVRLAELEQAQRQVLHELQEAVQPPTPQVECTDLGVHYLASDPTSPTGGDLYDWYVLPNGELHVAVVDVLGKGTSATKEALAVTHALRLLALEDRPLQSLIALADSLIGAQNPELVATVIVARYDPASGRVQLVGGSHPPAILLRADGTSETVHAPGMAIGWPGAGSDTVVELVLERNDVLVLYTDGLVEAGKDIVEGLEIATTEARSLSHYPAGQTARILVDRVLRHGERRDDTLALVLRRRTPPPLLGRPLGPFEHRFVASTAMVPLARHLLLDWLDHQPVDPAEVEDIPLIVSELCTNAVKAATGEVVLRAWTEGDSVLVEVVDDGDHSFTRVTGGALDLPSLDGESGRGLFLVEALTDDVEVTPLDPGGTAVRVVKKSVLANATTPS